MLSSERDFTAIVFALMLGVPAGIIEGVFHSGCATATGVRFFAHETQAVGSQIG